MCSTPRSSSSCYNQRSRRKSPATDHATYARMLREASANFERMQALKEERRLKAAESDQER